jgi:acetolactate synthase regulatory subunit
MATQSDVTVVVRRVEGVLVRLLGAAVRRGFEPIAVSAGPGAAGTFDVHLTLESTRPVEGLVRHLAGLYDVERVEVCGHDA